MADRTFRIATTVVLVIIGVLFLGVTALLFVPGGQVRPARTNPCKSDTKTLKTAIAAWNKEHLDGEAGYATPYPPSEAALTDARTRMLQDESSLHDLIGGGLLVPRIVKAPGKCGSEDITQIYES